MRRRPAGTRPRSQLAGSDEARASGTDAAQDVGEQPLFAGGQVIEERLAYGQGVHGDCLPERLLAGRPQHDEYGRSRPARQAIGKVVG